MNGVINLSVLDGWWDEGYDGENGWAIKPASPRARRRTAATARRARTLYELLQDQVIPLYYDRARRRATRRSGSRIAKRSMASLLPRYDASRMLGEYVSKFYLPASRQGRRYADERLRPRRRPSPRGRRACAPPGPAWPRGASMRRRRRIQFGDSLPVEVAVKLNGLAPADVRVELLLSRELRGTPADASTATSSRPPATGARRRAALRARRSSPGYPAASTTASASIPRHDLLTHPFETGSVLLGLASSASERPRRG